MVMDSFEIAAQAASFSTVIGLFGPGILMDR
jgi:hypothetical protein